MEYNALSSSEAYGLTSQLRPSTQQLHCVLRNFYKKALASNPALQRHAAHWKLNQAHLGGFVFSAEVKWFCQEYCITNSRSNDGLAHFTGASIALVYLHGAAGACEGDRGRVAVEPRLNYRPRATVDSTWASTVAPAPPQSTSTDWGENGLTRGGEGRQ